MAGAVRHLLRESPGDGHLDESAFSSSTSGACAPPKKLSSMEGTRGRSSGGDLRVWLRSNGASGELLGRSFSGKDLLADGRGSEVRADLLRIEVPNLPGEGPGLSGGEHGRETRPLKGRVARTRFYQLTLPPRRDGVHGDAAPHRPRSEAAWWPLV